MSRCQQSSGPSPAPFFCPPQPLPHVSDLVAGAVGVATPPADFGPAAEADPEVEGAGEGSVARLQRPLSWLSERRARWLVTEAPELWRDRWKNKN